MPGNRAAWFAVRRGQLQVGEAPYTPPARREIVVRNRAVAINPVDWAIPFMGHIGFPWIKPPTVLGSDVSGEVVEVGAEVTRFKVGDRVVGHALGLNQNRNRAAEGAFQLHTVLSDHMAAPIPDALSFAQASVLPLGLSTAACGLFQKDFLALQYPSADARPTGKTLVIWGGASSVACNAIQLAAAAGYEVFATASPRNFAYLRSLGATQIFDYSATTVVADIIAALEDRTIAGAFSIASGSAGPCLDIVHRARGDKFVALAAAPVPLKAVAEGKGSTLAILSLLPAILASSIASELKARTRGIASKFVFGGSLADNAVGPAIWVDFLPKALADGRYIAAPPAEIVGDGLDAIEAAFAVQQAGVSARKIVVSL